jgi:hypothetical protein
MHKNKPYFLVMKFPNISIDKLENGLNVDYLSGSSQAYHWIYDLWEKTLNVTEKGKFDICDSETISISHKGNNTFKFITLSNNKNCLVIDSNQVYLVYLSEKNENLSDLYQYTNDITGATGSYN